MHLNYIWYYRAFVFLAVAPKLRYTEFFSQYYGAAKEDSQSGAKASTGHVV